MKYTPVDLPGRFKSRSFQHPILSYESRRRDHFRWKSVRCRQRGWHAFSRRITHGLRLRSGANDTVSDFRHSIQGQRGFNPVDEYRLPFASADEFFDWCRLIRSWQHDRACYYNAKPKQCAYLLLFGVATKIYPEQFTGANPHASGKRGWFFMFRHASQFLNRSELI